ncbi:MAG: hypothetical protein ACFB2X_25025 [Rivularia sp. (in: cyanobacteria)]
MSWKKLFWLGSNLTIFLSLVSVSLVVAAITENKWGGDSTIAHLLWISAGLTGCLLLIAVLLQLSYTYNWAGAPIVVKPIHNRGTDVAIIFIQGEEIPIKLYCPVAKAIQDAAPDLNIWVGIPQFIGDSPIPRETGLAIDKVISQMHKEGMPETDNIFFAAHSVGGIAIQKYLKSFPKRAKGQILMGSFLGKGYVSKLDDKGKTKIEYTVPTLTIGGTLDGLARITRIARGFWHQQINPSKSTDIDNFPVIAIDGATHMQFASGKAIGYVADFDLKPKFSQEKIHEQIGELVYNFISSRLPDTNYDSIIFLKEKRIKTQQMLQPIIDAFVKEGYNGFKPACYCNQSDNPRPNPKTTNCSSEPLGCQPRECTAYSPWIEKDANPIMAGRDSLLKLNPDAPSFNFLDSFHRSYTVTFRPPWVHIPKITKIDGKLKITSVTQALYHFLDSFDTGFFPIAAFSLRAKLNSRQKIWKHAGVKNPNFKQTDGSSRGNEINQQVYKWALEHAGEEARSYFDQNGVQMLMGEDSIPIVSAGPLWVWVYPKYKYIRIDNEQFCQVRARVMKTPINYPIRSASGFHYCQLLSPASAMEWIYIDGLRAKASVSGTTITYGPLAGGLGQILKFLLRILLRQTRIKALVGS